MAEISELVKQNPWWAMPAAIDSDPKIRDFDAAPIKWSPRLRRHMALDKDVVYSLRGPRQVGKTTLVKVIIREELKKRKPTDIFYYTCDLITDPKVLKDLIETFLLWSQRQGTERKLIFLDEVSRVKDWEFALKNIVDMYSLRDKTFVLTGSSSWDLKHGIERLPGRKGELTGEQNHKILLPMKFSEYVALRDPILYSGISSSGLADNKIRKDAFLALTRGEAEKWLDPIMPHQQRLDDLFDEYLLSGGVMSAVNQLVSKGEIQNTTYELYLQFFMGDLAKLMREEATAKKILAAVIRHQGKPVGWSNISKEMDIHSPITVTQYADVLKNLFALNIYNAFDQNRRMPKFRSEKKIQIPNPFFFHAFRGYIENPAGDYFRQAKDFVQTTEGKALLAEYVVGDHLCRLAYNFAPSDLYDQSDSVFYVRTNKGECVDFIVRVGQEFVPVEVKYQSQINSGDFRQLQKFKHGLIASRQTTEIRDRYAAIPVPILLMFI